MENRLPSLLHKTFTRYRLTCTVAISLAVHLLVWGAVVWSGVLNPNIILAEKSDQKHQLTLDFIKPRSKQERQNSSPPPQKTKKIPTVFVQVDSKQSSAKKPEDTDKYSNKNSLATNLFHDSLHIAAKHFCAAARVPACASGGMLHRRAGDQNTHTRSQPTV